jgi:hypothetical protein
LSLAGLPTQTEKSPDFRIIIPKTVFIENRQKFPYDTYNPPKASKYPQNIDVLSNYNF